MKTSTSEQTTASEYTVPVLASPSSITSSLHNISEVYGKYSNIQQRLIRLRDIICSAAPVAVGEDMPIPEGTSHQLVYWITMLEALANDMEATLEQIEVLS